MSQHWDLQWRRAAALAAATILAVLAPAGAADDPGAADVPRKLLALLVGCTQYPDNNQVPTLQGPANDVPKLAELLHKKFDFPEANITQLVGWPDDAARRPTNANISAAFKDLIARADADTQIVILLAGHGMRIPILEPAKAQNWKANHLAFLPADVKSWSGDAVENALPDDQILDCLNQLRQKGASVLVVFDCCHAGSMVRGGDPKMAVERVRTVNPQALGIPDAVLDQSVAKARKGAREDPTPGARARGGPELLPSGLGLASSLPGKGSVTAFFACQPFEEAPELPRPAGEALTPEHYYGLLSFTLVTVLNEQGKQRTYRELAHALTSKYTQERGSRGPTPLVEGDLDREVLGLKRWPGRSAVILEKHDDALQITAGALMGVTPKSILAVHPPAGQPGGDKTILAYVRVTATTPGRADVEPCPRGEEPAVAADKLPEGAVCTLVERDLGEMKLKVAVAKTVGDDTSEAGKKRSAALVAALAALPKEMKEDYLEMVPDEAAAEWVLGLDADKVVLWQGVGAPLDPAKIEENAKDLKKLGQPVPRHEYGGYPISDPSDVKALTGRLQNDFQKIFTWQSLWRIAGASQACSSGADEVLKFEVIQLTEDGRPGDPLPSGAAVRSGQPTQLQLINHGQEDLYVTLVSLDANLRISVKTRSLQHGASINTKGKITSDTFGREGIVVLALPQSVSKDEPRYDFLEQDPLHDYHRGVEHSRGVDLAPKTPFGQLVKTAATGKGTRGFDPEAPTNPFVLSCSWTTLPKVP